MTNAVIAIASLTIAATIHAAVSFIRQDRAATWAAIRESWAAEERLRDSMRRIYSRVAGGAR